MEIGTVLQSTTTNSNAAPAQSNKAISSDFETFIKMLTVQMQNQDPLNPIESSDFAVQLATFSTVEQQVLTNDLLANLGNQRGALSVAQLSGWVGMEARAEMPVAFNGAPVTLTLRAESLGDKSELVVRNSQGTEIQRLDVPISGGEYIWAGKDSFDNVLPDGTYTITTEATSRGEVVATHPVEIHGRIIEARNDNGQPTLVMVNGQQVSADKVLGIRASSD